MAAGRPEIDAVAHHTLRLALLGLWLAAAGSCKYAPVCRLAVCALPRMLRQLFVCWLSLGSDISIWSP